MEQDLGAGGGELARDIAADAVGRAGDQNRLAIHLHLDLFVDYLPRARFPHGKASDPRTPICGAAPRVLNLANLTRFGNISIVLGGY